MFANAAGVVFQREFICIRGTESKLCKSYLEQQLADLIFPLGSGFMERRELPQVGHVDRGSVSDQQLGHLVVTVRTGVMEGNQTSVKGKQRLHTQNLSREPKSAFKCLLLC